jgi:HNH endonuclease
VKPKVTLLGPLKIEKFDEQVHRQRYPNGGFVIPGDHVVRSAVDGSQAKEPVLILPFKPQPQDKVFRDLCEGIFYYVFRDSIWRVENCQAVAREDIPLYIKHAVYRQEQSSEKVKREVQASENFERLPDARRERIPDSVRLFVWQRDEGRCVRCQSKERLEFDHIIPVVEGGSSTERNIQLLCEPCNRSKGKQT